MDIRPITTEADYKAALAEIKRLWDAAPATPERNLLEVWAMLAHHYEREREPLPRLDPAQAIRFRLDQLGLNRKALLPIFGSSGRVSEILSGKRSLTLEHIVALHERFEIPFESLIVSKTKRKRKSARRKPRTQKAGRHSRRAA